MSAIPTLGYPTRTQAAAGLKARGMTNREISAAIGVPTATVAALLCGARERKRTWEKTMRAVAFPVDVLDRLAVHAARRGVHVNTLCRRIVEEVVEGNVVDAVLDDMP